MREEDSHLLCIGSRLKRKKTSKISFICRQWFMTQVSPSGCFFVTIHNTRIEFSPKRLNRLLTYQPTIKWVSHFFEAIFVDRFACVSRSAHYQVKNIDTCVSPLAIQTARAVNNQTVLMKNLLPSQFLKATTKRKEQRNFYCFTRTQFSPKNFCKSFLVVLVVGKLFPWKIFFSSYATFVSLTHNALS